MEVSEFCKYLILVAFIVVLWYQVKYRKRNAMLSQIPPITPTYPVIGSNLSLLGSTTEVLKKTEKISKELGPVWRYDMTPFVTGVFVSDEKFLEDLLSSTKLTSKGDEYEFMRSWLGDGKHILKTN
jgi:hypothetical protein